MVIGLIACDKKGSAEQAGESIDNTAENIGDKMEGATDNAGDKV